MKWLLSLALLTSCGGHRLVVYNEYVCEDYLASSWVGTPDPLKCEGFVGQQLIIRWILPPGSLYGVDDAAILLRVRFRNHEEDVICLSINRLQGSHVYWLLNDDYCEKKGILTYKVEVLLDGEVFDCWKHQIWTELIDFDV